MTKDEIDKLEATQKKIKATLVMYSGSYGYWVDLNGNYFFSSIDGNYFPIKTWDNSREVVERVFAEYVSSGMVDYDRLEKL